MSPMLTHVTERTVHYCTFPLQMVRGWAAFRQPGWVVCFVTMSSLRNSSFFVIRASDDAYPCLVVEQVPYTDEMHARSIPQCHGGCPAYTEFDIQVSICRDFASPHLGSPGADGRTSRAMAGRFSPPMLAEPHKRAPYLRYKG